LSRSAHRSRIFGQEDSTMRSIVMLAALFAVAVPAGAQELASSMNQLRVLVRPGDDVEVTDLGGRRTKAKVESISNAGLELWVQGALKAVPEDQVATIRARRPPDVAKGARNGFIAGALFGILPGAALAAHSHSSDALTLVAFTSLVYGGLGAGVGAGISAMIPQERLVYDAHARPAGSSVRAAPIVSGDRKGVVVSLGF
jgi:hypothetical protein